MIFKNRRVRNKRGQLMDITLVFAIIVFVSIVTIGYLQSKSFLPPSLVSPVEVLELGDSAIQFEGEEYAALKKIYCGSKDDSKGMKNRFCLDFNGFVSKSFLLDGTFPLEEGRGITSENLCEKVYTFSGDGSNLKVERGGLGRKSLLRAPDDNGIKFDVLFEYVLVKEYLLTKEDCNYELEFDRKDLA